MTPQTSFQLRCIPWHQMVHTRLHTVATDIYAFVTTWHSGLYPCVRPEYTVPKNEHATLVLLIWLLTYSSQLGCMTFLRVSSIRCPQTQQAKHKAWETILENNFPYTLPKSVFDVNFRLITGHHYLQHLKRIRITDSPMCPPCGGAEMHLHHIQKCEEFDR
jgi:hypothetical protein